MRAASVGDKIVTLENGITFQKGQVGIVQAVSVAILQVIFEGQTTRLPVANRPGKRYRLYRGLKK